MTQLTIKNGETTEIIPADQAAANETYLLAVSDAAIRLGHSHQYARNGNAVQPGDRVKLDNLRGKAIFAYAATGDATLDIDTAGVDVSYQPRESLGNLSSVETINQIQTINALENQSSVSTSAIDPTNSFGDVPVQTTARLKAANANADPVMIGSYALSPGETLTMRVTNLNVIPVDGTSGDQLQAVVPGGS